MANHNLVAAKRDLSVAGEQGNLSCRHFQYTLAGVVQNDVVYFGKLPAGVTVVDGYIKQAALGAGTGITVGYIKVNAGDTLTADPDAYATDADTAAAAQTRFDVSVIPASLAVETYVTLTATADATHAGLVDIVVYYIYDGE